MQTSVSGPRPVTGARTGTGPPPARRPHVLVVDDHRDTLHPLARLLWRHGHEVTCAHTGAGALALAEGRPVDVLICEVDLPDGDGCDLLVHVRRLYPRVRGVAVCSEDPGRHEEQCRQAGFERLLTKPLLFELALAAVEGGTPTAAQLDGRG